MPAPTSVPSATRTPCARCRASGNSPLPSAALLVGQCATVAAGRPSTASSAVGRVHVVRQHAARPDQPVPVVGVDVVAAEQFRHGGDLARVLVDVRGEQRTRHVGEQRAAGGEQLVAAREREARRHGVAGAARAVPALGQGEPLGVRAVGRREQVLAQTGR